MQKILNWVSSNSAFIIAIAVVVFLILTIVMIIVLSAANSGARKQIQLLAKSMQYDYRPRVLPKFVTIDEKIKCLAFENIGTQYARNVVISIDKQWLEAKAKLPDFQSNNEQLSNLSGKKIILCPGERLLFALYVAGAASVELFKNQPLRVALKYNDNSERIRYEENFLLDLAMHDDTVSQGSEHERGISRLNEKLERLEGALKDIDYRIYDMSMTQKRALDLKSQNTTDNK